MALNASQGLKTAQISPERPKIIRNDMKQPDTAQNATKRPKTAQRGPNIFGLASSLIQAEFSALIEFFFGFFLHPN
jgi:hypothetical protein